MTTMELDGPHIISIFADDESDLWGAGTQPASES